MMPRWKWGAVVIVSAEVVAEQFQEVEVEWRSGDSRNGNNGREKSDKSHASEENRPRMYKAEGGQESLRGGCLTGRF